MLDDEHETTRTKYVCGRLPFTFHYNPTIKKYKYLGVLQGSHKGNEDTGYFRKN